MGRRRFAQGKARTTASATLIDNDGVSRQHFCKRLAYGARAELAATQSGTFERNASRGAADGIQFCREFLKRVLWVLREMRQCMQLAILWVELADLARISKEPDRRLGADHD